MFEKIREDGSKRLRMDTYPTLFAHSALPKRRKPPADRSVALQPSLASPFGDHSYASADVSHAPNDYYSRWSWLSGCLRGYIFGISAIYKVWFGEVSYCFVGMLPSCISMMSYFSELSPWILIQPLLSWIWRLWKKKFRYFMAGYVKCALVEICSAMSSGHRPITYPIINRNK